jgi:NAD(P)-dependent dehydrogenase (short-subunit alcohol dehydrogenase family)
VITFFAPAQKTGRASKTPGSVLDRHYALKWVSFRSAATPNYLYSETYYPKARFVDDPAGRAYIEQTVPAGRLAEPEEIGELIHYLATMQGTFMTGAIIDFSGGWPVSVPPPN